VIDKPKRHVIAEPYPETIGVSSLTIWVPEDFRGDAEIVWWYPGKNADADKQCMSCNTVWLLQGVFHGVSGTSLFGPRMSEYVSKLFAARVVALVVHEFYRQRIKRAAQLEAAYQWQSYPLL
jgi:hypothetical protein